MLQYSPHSWMSFCHDGLLETDQEIEAVLTPDGPTFVELNQVGKDSGACSWRGWGGVASKHLIFGFPLNWVSVQVLSAFFSLVTSRTLVHLQTASVFAPHI